MFSGSLHEIDKLLAASRKNVDTAKVLLDHIKGCLEAPTPENLKSAIELVGEVKHHLNLVQGD